MEITAINSNSINRARALIQNNRSEDLKGSSFEKISETTVKRVKAAEQLATDASFSVRI